MNVCMAKTVNEKKKTIFEFEFEFEMGKVKS